MRHTAISRIRSIYVGVCVVSFALLLVASNPQSTLADADGNGWGAEMLKAVVVLESTSGRSYMADRDSIVTMPALHSEEEMESFIAQYRADANSVQTTIASLEAIGFSVTTHDDIFAFIAGTQEQFAQLVSPRILNARFRMGDSEADQAVFAAHELEGQALHIDGMIMYRWQDDNSQASDASSETDTRAAMSLDADHCRAGYTSVSGVMQYLGVDLAHARGLTGKGVRVGFIDRGVYTGHRFFLERPVDIQSYRLVNGQVTRVASNFSTSATSMGHGTMVAAYLNAVAPQARLLSFAQPVAALPWGTLPHQYVAEYINYMHTHNLVDVISLSIGQVEEAVPQASFIAEIRTQMIYSISKGAVILVAAGNSGQGGQSGHNVLAAIPEVIAVGGAIVNDHLDFSAASGDYGGGITGAASFESRFFPGRRVPDVVGIFGDDLCYPYPMRLWYSYYRNHRTCGTSAATPQIAGMVALLLEQDPSITPTQVRAMLEQSAFDITSGQSGDGDHATVGYDAATGHGLPLATWVLNEHVVLHEGWNLIGLLKEHATSYSAVDLLQEINGQGGDCDNVSYWDSGAGRYVAVVVYGDEVYGFDFDLTPDIGFWVRCGSWTLWNPTGSSYIRSPATLSFRAGWNHFAIPYANVPCTVDDLGYETSWRCWHVVEYDGQMQNWRGTGVSTYGNNFLLRSGKGYLVMCDEAVTWTPDCSRWVSTADDTTPRNTFSSKMTRDSIPPLSHPWNIADAQALQQAEAIDPKITNVTDRQFSVYWNTALPSGGAILLTEGYRGGVVFTAFDDRGVRFAGKTHHITLRGLKPETTYYFAVVSDGTVRYDDSLGQPFQATTGRVLGFPSQDYDLRGHIHDANGEAVYDAVVTAFLWSADETSTLLSVPIGTQVEGYSIMLDNVRNVDTGDYVDFSKLENILVEAAGNAGLGTRIRSVSLGTAPSIEIDLSLSLQPPEQPTLISPGNADTIQERAPVFCMHADDEGGHDLTYRLELSRDGFASIERRYDQGDSPVGWSSSSYTPGQLACFTPPALLEDLVGYHWRVFAFNGQAWSPVSSINTFAVEAPVQVHRVFLPLILRAQ